MDKFLKFFSSIGQFGEVGLVCLGGRPVVYVVAVVYAFIDLLYYLNCLRDNCSIRLYRYIHLYGSWFISNCLRAGEPRGNATISV